MELEMRIVKKVAAAAMAMAVVFGAAFLKPVAANAAQAGPETASVMEEENSFLSHQDEAYQNEFLRRVNSERAKAGLKPVQLGDSSHNSAAQERAKELASSYSYVRPNGQRDFTVFAENGIEDVSIGEDYMAGVSTPDAAVDQWMNIDFARERILNADATTMSVGHYEGGVYNNYWVLIFSYPENSYTSDYRQRVLDLVNAERANYGLQPLVMGDAKLTAAAQHRAEEIATVNSHVRPNGSKWYTVLSEYGVTDAASGENAAWGQRFSRRGRNGMDEFRRPPCKYSGPGSPRNGCWLLLQQLQHLGPSVDPALYQVIIVIICFLQKNRLGRRAQPIFCCLF